MTYDTDVCIPPGVTMGNASRKLNNHKIIFHYFLEYLQIAMPKSAVPGRQKRGANWSYTWNIVANFALLADWKIQSTKA